MTISQIVTVEAVRRLEIVPTRNELFWIEVIRTASKDSDPTPTLALAQKLRCMFRAHLSEQQAGGESSCR
jgi:hypothetical protein